MHRTCLIGLAVLLFFSTRLFGQAPVIQWQKTLGSYNGDYPQSVRQTSDGGYIVGGYTEGADGDMEGYHGNIVIGDLWVTKLSASGSLQWAKCLGGTYTEVNTDIRQTADGGYVLAGSSASVDCGMAPNHGGLDIWLVKLSPAGDIQWQYMYGGSGNEYATSVNPTPDGGYIIGGYTSSSDGQVTGFHPNGSYSFDWWIIKVDASGNLVSIAERTKIYQDGDKITYEEGDKKFEVPFDSKVSMNFWGFDPSVFDYTEKLFTAFLKAEGTNPKAEFFIPIIGDRFIKEGKGVIKVIPTAAQWFGVTYKEDAPDVQASLNALIAKGEYPKKLW